MAFVPDDYTKGYEKAKKINPKLASAYIEHTLIGDPEVDPIIEELSSLGREKTTQLMTIALDGETGTLPASLKNFVEKFKTPPTWFDPKATLPACELYYRYPDSFLMALATGGLIEGFTTNISKSFLFTGRLLQGGDQGIRRLKQNIRHQMEIFLPGGLDPYADGWKTTLRLRFVHAQIRFLLKQEKEWKTKEWGTPLNAAHMALAHAVFSGRILINVQHLLNQQFSSDECSAFMAIWRYVGYLMGFPDAIPVHTIQDAQKVFHIGTLCEPPPGPESIVMANTLLRSGPSLSCMDGKKAKKLEHQLYSISRCLIGNTLADQLNFPKFKTLGVVKLYALKVNLRKLPWVGNLFRCDSSMTDFELMMSLAEYDKKGISYLLPDNALAELQKHW